MIAGRSKSGLIFIFLFFFSLFRISILSAQQRPVADSLTSESKTALHKDTTLIRGTPYEVVGIGYGSLRKRELTTSVTTIYSDEFNKGNIENPLQLIQGKVAGLSISKSDIQDLIQTPDMRIANLILEHITIRLYQVSTEGLNGPEQDHLLLVQT